MIKTTLIVRSLTGRSIIYLH